MKKILSVLVAAGLLGGCGQPSAAVSVPSSASDAGAASSAVSSATAEGTVSRGAPRGESKPHENGRLGRVTAIDGNVITLESMGGGKRPDGERGEIAAGKEGEKPADMPEASGEEPPMNRGKGAGPGKGAGSNGEQGTPPAGAPGNRTGETLSVTLPDDCEILLKQQEENTAGTIADITVGSMIRITYDEDGETVKTVTVMGELDPEKMPRPAQDDSTPQAAEQTASAE